jgi:hypothetical protein
MTQTTIITLNNGYCAFHLNKYSSKFIHDFLKSKFNSKYNTQRQWWIIQQQDMQKLEMLLQAHNISYTKSIGYKYLSNDRIGVAIPINSDSLYNFKKSKSLMDGNIDKKSQLFITQRMNYAKLKDILHNDNYSFTQFEDIDEISNTALLFSYDDYCILKFSYSSEIINELKMLPYRRYYPVNKVWKFRILHKPLVLNIIKNFDLDLQEIEELPKEIKDELQNDILE